ncbi:DUF5103 domain-containing protein [Olivibacter sitiensis]|uniref:type IX secretion system plug protein n=1 Tax=Olivibacter sitiensis TaxID=376470 RepID=UPI0006845004|nr:DUF5103 domain-containing protein [Olivibacter sitiensis]
MSLAKSQRRKERIFAPLSTSWRTLLASNIGFFHNLIAFRGVQSCFTGLACTRCLVIVLLLSLPVLSAHAQKKEKRERQKIVLSPRQELAYENKDYLPEIKSVNFYKLGEEQSFPIIDLNSGDQLFMSFDDLRADNRNYSYSIEHCNANGEKSVLLPLEYIDGLTEERIYDFAPSINTLQPYTHYSFTFPAENGLKPKISGNYLLKIYEDNDPDRLIITRRFYVVIPAAGMSAQLLPSYQVTKRSSNQKIDLVVNTGTLNINNPYQDIKILVMQNQRPDVQQWLQKPSNIRQGELIYQDNNSLDFPGGNEFRSVDLRSLRTLSQQVARFEKDSINQIWLLPDVDWSDQSYSYLFDEGGNFYLRNSDFDDSDVQGDYITTNFSLQTDKTPEASEKVFVLGKFNNYALNEENELQYDKESKSWKGGIPLKQGLYDYTYVSVDKSGTTQPYKYNGNHFETKNTYQVLLYYRRPTSRWDELVGFIQVSSTK